MYLFPNFHNLGRGNYKKHWHFDTPSIRVKEESENHEKLRKWRKHHVWFIDFRSYLSKIFHFVVEIAFFKKIFRADEISFLN